MEQLNGIKREAKLLFPSVRYVGKMGGEIETKSNKKSNENDTLGTIPEPLSICQSGQ